MYSSSVEFGELIQQDSRTFIAKLLLDGAEEIIGSIKSVKINGGSNSASDFSIGSVMSQYIDVVMMDPGIQLEGKEMLLQIGMEVNEAKSDASSTADTFIFVNHRQLFIIVFRPDEFNSRPAGNRSKIWCSNCDFRTTVI